MNHPDISIIVPVCNVENYLESCIISLQNQTLKNIEIICIDDFSPDNCSSILKQYAQSDPRIINIFHEKNLGTSQARKDGVLASHGKYIMFVDGDDTLVPEACEVAFNAIEKHGTDMVQFDVNIVNCAGVSDARIESNKKAMSPCLEYINQANLISACWDEKLFGFNLWNKIYNGDICRKAFKNIEDGYYPKAQDLYAFFLIAYYSKTSIGIEDTLYNYNFGIGITGGDYISQERFEILLTEYEVYKALERFIKQKQELEQYQPVLQKIKHHFLNECVNKWKNNLKPELSSTGFQQLIDIWGFEDVLCMLAERNWFNRSQIAEKMLDIDYFKHKCRPKKHKTTIAAYYRSISNGGAQRVVATLCNIWAAMKDSYGNPLYNVVLITDVQPTEDEYELDSSVKREFLPDFESAIRDQYRDRFHAWSNILSKHNIDIVVSSMWVASCTLWDMLSVKGHTSKPAFLIHSHNFCCLPYRFMGNTGLELTYSYQLCDGVVTLSECDRKFAGSFSPNTKCIVNPITFSPQDLPTSTYENNNLVWVGRISSEKRPFDAVYMMDYIVKEIPDAKLYIVGSGDEAIYQKLNDLIVQLHLQDNIILVGFTTEVMDYYKKAMVYIGTSEYEGFSLTFCEAMSYAVPIVSYDMPWLTFMQDGRGIIPVKQRRFDLLAKEVINLLKNPALCRQLGSEGKEQVKEMAQVDIGSEWKKVFDNIGSENSNTNSNDINEIIIYQYLSIYQQLGKNSIKSSLEHRLKETYEQKSELNRKLQITYDEKFERGVKIKELSKRINQLERAKNEIESSTTFKVGKIIMFIPTRLKNMIKQIIKRR